MNRIAICVVLAALGLAGCQNKPSPHHWEVWEQPKSAPWDKEWAWVDDASGRADDCQITFNNGRTYETYIRGRGYGEYENLEDAKHACYANFGDR